VKRGAHTLAGRQGVLAGIEHEAALWNECRVRSATDSGVIAEAIENDA
jgi:hypothetical protein